MSGIVLLTLFLASTVLVVAQSLFLRFYVQKLGPYISLFNLSPAMLVVWNQVWLQIRTTISYAVNCIVLLPLFLASILIVGAHALFLAAEAR